jgi:hypothetical protein
MDRVALYTGLFELAKDLDEDETGSLENWLRNGGEFPAPKLRNQPLQADVVDLTGDGEEEDEENDWPEYHPEDFEVVASETGEDDHDPNFVEEEGENAATINFTDGDRDSSSEGESDDENEDLHDSLTRSPLKGKSAIECVECLICAESFTLTEFPPSTQITSTCNHKDEERVCVYCLQQSIAAAVTEGQLNLIVCPFCPEKLSHSDVKKYATHEIFARYVSQDFASCFILLTAFSRFEYLTMIATPDLVMCLGLNCGSGQINVDGDTMMI